MLGHGFGLGMVYLSLFGLVITALLVTVVALLWPRASGDGDTRRILAGRLARGEITVDEYQRLLDLLRPDHQTR